ncbi:hypothetical protein [Frankia sp. Cppng1_Ct_nod]|uniref:hypothetical protein n=1 Tax=Frankia sp. Cppng1_Ct_nod TaxID=2897162 RepID=UPI0010414273|nr:hypothetical protein [Frankia sp. Cppng1_Ct_nod]
MTTPNRFSDIASAIRAELASVTRLAHVRTFHPNAFDWSEASTPSELAFLSEVVYGELDHETQAVAYVTKELAQLAEIERHVSAVIALTIGELHDLPDPVNVGHDLHHALSCFAAEEIQHANTFYRYVRMLAGSEARVDKALFNERFDVFRTDDHPYVKLVALCCSAYVGESVITIFEHRADALDPHRARFFTRLLHTHGLDEARHIKIDHVAMKSLYPALTIRQQSRVRQLVRQIEELNRRLAQSFQQTTELLLGVDFVTDNPAAAVQLQLTRTFAERIFTEDGALHTADEVLDAELRGLISAFSGVDNVHGPDTPTLSAALPGMLMGTQ